MTLYEYIPCLIIHGNLSLSRFFCIHSIRQDYFLTDDSVVCIFMECSYDRKTSCFCFCFLARNECHQYKFLSIISCHAFGQSLESRRRHSNITLDIYQIVSSMFNGISKKRWRIFIYLGTTLCCAVDCDVIFHLCSHGHAGRNEIVVDEDERDDRVLLIDVWQNSDGWGNSNQCEQ